MSEGARISPARLALAARKLRGEREDLALLASDPVAVIGMACRFPGQSDSPETYWRALAEGRNCIVEMPESRWPDRATLEPAQRLGGYLEAIDGFDAEYFGIAPREAGQIDPQQRLLLEVVWEALWNAGLEPASLAGTRAGVFASLYNNDYGRMQFSERAALGAYAGIGTAHSIAAGRVSYLLNLRGPSLCVDTACSSSLVATHLAVESLRSGESGLAIVAASSLKVLPDEVVVFTKWGMLARDGKCKTFDAGADGFAAGEGAGAVILKRLSDALQDGDRVRAVIRGAAVNHDGRSTVLTAPNGLAQQAVIRAALENARIDPAEVGYIETHGTGTSLGDPIEVEALEAVYGVRANTEQQPCVLGAVKTNIGHLEAAAGVAGLIKTVLCLENEAIPRNLHFRTLNPQIALEGSRLTIPTETVAWSRGARARVAGVSSFGLGGTNAHVILEEAPAVPAGRGRAPLPKRAWQRERCWLSEQATIAAGAGAASSDRAEWAVHPLLGRSVRTAFVQGQIFESEIGTDAVPYLREHGLGDRPLLPFAAFLEIAHAAGRQSRADGSLEIREFTVAEPLFLRGAARTVQTLVSGGQVEIASEGDGGWVKHARGLVGAPEGTAPKVNLDAVRARCSEAVAPADIYRRLEATGLRYGAGFRVLMSVWKGAGESLAVVRLPQAIHQEAAEYALHPVLLDGCLQAVMAAVPEIGDELLLPLAVESFQVCRTGAADVSVHVAVRGQSAELVEADLTLTDEAGVVIAALRGFQAKRTTRAAGIETAQNEAPAYEMAWRAMPLALSAAHDGKRRRCLLLEETQGRASDVAARLTAGGADVVIAPLAEARDRLGEGEWTDVVVCLMRRSTDESAGWEHGEQAGVSFVLEFAKSLRTQPALRLWVVAPGAGAVVPGEAVCLTHAPLTGLVRTLGCEHPGTNPVLMDADPIEESEAIAREVLASGGDPAVAIRRGTRYAVRLTAAVPGTRRVERLVSDSPGVLDALRWESSERPAPRLGEIEIEVRAHGLNFRDVLNALGVFDLEHPRFGAECAGIVTRVGAAVKRFRPGDRVLAFAPYSLQSYAVVAEAYAAALPRRMGLAEAATVPVAFLTAHYGFSRLGQMGRGQRVLIHAAAGGLGLAAVQLAQRAGAEVYATAGSERKREFLRGLGVREVFDSRSASFRDGVLQATGGRGVDAVLNSLNGELIPAGLESLAPNGCFLEVGKRGIWSAEAVQAVRPDVRYCVFDLGEVAREEPELIRTMLGELMPEFAAGRLEPLRTTVFPAEEAAAAFRMMAQAGHMGKIVLSRGAEGEAGNLSRMVDGGSVLVVGGTGALGRAVAEWLAEKGVRRLVLASRTAHDEMEWAQSLRDLGADVIFEPMDVTNAASVEAVLGRIRASGAPLKAVFHTAGVVQDRVLEGETWEGYRQAAAAKVEGGWNLHRLTEDDPVELMVFFSSAAGVLGSPGQGSYAAANTFLDGLAHERRARGLATLSVDWGAWASAGMAARLAPEHAARLQRQGMGMLEAGAALAALDKAIGELRTQVTVLEVDWERFLNGRTAADGTLFSELRGREAHAAEPAVAANSIRDALLHAAAADRRSLLAEHVRTCARRALSLRPEAAVQMDVPLQEIGLDSLMAIDMKNDLAQSLELSLSAGLLFNYPTVGQLTEYLLGQLPVAEVAAAAGAGDDEATLAGLSEEEAERLLLEELERSGSEAAHA